MYDINENEMCLHIYIYLIKVLRLGIVHTIIYDLVGT